VEWRPSKFTRDVTSSITLASIISVNGVVKADSQQPRVAGGYLTLNAERPLPIRSGGFHLAEEKRMANNYLQFSEAIYKLSEDERAWCEARLRHLEGLLPTLVDDGKDETYVPCAPEDRPYLNGAGCLCFLWSINPEQDGHCLWIYTEENGDAQQVALFVQEFLARFRSNEYFTLTWAETCSKPRISEFSGGALFVTADEIAWNGAFPWLGEKIREFDRRKDRAEK
jgi:hypothetical protein